MTDRRDYHDQPSGLTSRLDDHAHDDLTHELDARPCTLCGEHPMRLPHSICKVCLEEKRFERIMSVRKVAVFLPATDEQMEERE